MHDFIQFNQQNRLRFLTGRVASDYYFFCLAHFTTFSSPQLPGPPPFPSLLTAIADMGKKGDDENERLTRIAIVSTDKCKPKKCRQECKKSCPVVRMG